MTLQEIEKAHEEDVLRITGNLLERHTINDVLNRESALIQMVRECRIFVSYAACTMSNRGLAEAQLSPDEDSLNGLLKRLGEI